MLDVIELFRERETRDELGIGVVRDAFADAFFPGTSTIQTRARYFLFVAWTYRRLERHGVGSARVVRMARQREISLIKPLASSEDSAGTIGVQAGKNLKRLPSSIYWQGLWEWGIRLFPGSQEQYHRSLDGYHAYVGRSQRSDDGEPMDELPSGNWHAGLPAEPESFPKEASFSLRRDEAEYLRERILAAHPRSLLAFLVDQGHEAGAVEFPWEHPQFGNFPEHIREELDHARNFSETIHGAALLYNLMLAEELSATGEANELVELYRGWMRDWTASLDERHTVLAAWDRERFWELVALEGARVSTLTRAFIDSWLELALDGAGTGVVALDEGTRRLIRERERLLKRGQARLGNRGALELWNGAAGIQPLSYRWPAARVIVADILRGLEGEDGDA
jgi:hypothetical protein